MTDFQSSGVFPTVAADDRRTADGGFTPEAMAAYWAAMSNINSTPSMVQTLQEEGVNPNLYGALSFGAYAEPEYANLTPADNSALNLTNPLSSGGQVVPTNGGVSNLTNATTSYLGRLSATEEARRLEGIQNNQAFTASQMTGNAYNPTGANSYAIQNSGIGNNTNIPLYNLTNNGTREENEGQQRVISPPVVNNTPTDTKVAVQPKLATMGGGLSSTGNAQYRDREISGGFTGGNSVSPSLVDNTNLTKPKSGSINWTKALWR